MSAEKPRPPLAGQAFYDSMWRQEPAEINRHERDRFATLQRLITSLSRPNDLILDAGCGTGKLSACLKPYGSVMGIDWSTGGLEVARSRVPGVKFQRFDLAWGDVTPLAGRFGLVVSSEVIEHVGRSNREAVVRNLRAALSKGGFLLMTTPNRRRAEALAHLGARYQPEEELLTPEETTELLTANGLLIRWTGSATFLEALWEGSPIFRRLRSSLPRSAFGDDVIDQALRRTRFGLYFVVCASRTA